MHNATDWFAIKKGTTQSYGEAIKQGTLVQSSKMSGNE
jgi:hypothetical protein